MLSNAPENTLVYMRYTEYMIPLQLTTFRRIIGEEMEHLGRITNLPQIPVNYVLSPPADSPNQIAAFHYGGKKPKYFVFNIKNCDGYTMDSLLDTARHEFAHYVALKQFGASQGHNENWKKICRDVVKCLPESTELHKPFACIPSRTLHREPATTKVDYLSGKPWDLVWETTLRHARKGDAEHVRFCAFLAFYDNAACLPALLAKLHVLERRDPNAQFLGAYIRLQRKDGDMSEQLLSIKSAADRGCILANFFYGSWLMEGAYELKQSKKAGMNYVAKAMSQHCAPAMRWFSEKMRERKDFASTARAIELELGRNGIDDMLLPQHPCMSFVPYI